MDPSAFKTFLGTLRLTIGLSVESSIPKSVKKVRGKIKTNDLCSQSCIAIAGRRGAFNPAGVLPDIRPAYLRRFFREFFLCRTEA
jgi:hypothetical protein